VEPLYQYINTAEFLREPDERSTKPSDYEATGGGGGGGKKQNQLELARQLSCQRKLWCEQPEVVMSGVLDTLTSEERKLQEVWYLGCSLQIRLASWADHLKLSIFKVAV
jgi:hypothetical protein